MARIDCDFCAYCFDETLFVRANLDTERRMKDAEQKAEEQMRAEKNQGKLDTALRAVPGV